MKFCLIMILSILLWPGACLAGHEQRESWYQDKWCAGRGQTEVVMPDNTRCDCLTVTHAVEVDFAGKFYEAIGQSLYYSLQTGKRAGILLILEDKEDMRYWLRLNSVIQQFGLPIDTWTIGAGVI